MSDLTPTQAIKAAYELRSQFEAHERMLFRRQLRMRRIPPDLSAFGISKASLPQVVTHMTDVPNEEAHAFANAFSSPIPEIAVYTEGEQPMTLKRGGKLEKIYRATLQTLLADEYNLCLHMAAEGFGIGRLDIKRSWLKDIPERAKDELTDPYLKRVDDSRRAIGLPFQLVQPDPAAFYYDENKLREIIVGAEWGVRKQSVIDETYPKQRMGILSSMFGTNGKGSEIDELLGPTLPDQDATGNDDVGFVVLRTPTKIFHLLVDGSDAPAPSARDRVLWEGPNIFGCDTDHPSTGYVMWRGRYTGDSDIQERYEPFIMASLSIAEIMNFFITAQANFAGAALKAWLEREPEQTRLPSRDIEEAKTVGAQERSDGGNLAAEFAPGERVKYREVTGDLKEVLGRLVAESAPYLFPSVLSGEPSSADESGRAVIRRQEAASKTMRRGYEARQNALLELLSVIRRTLFTHKRFLEGGNSVYVQFMNEGVGPEGSHTLREQISLDPEDRVPHEITVTIGAQSQAAQLALVEEGMKIRAANQLSQDTVDQDYYGVKDPAMERRRRTKDDMRALIRPYTLSRLQEALKSAFDARRPATIQIPTEQQNGASGGGATPGVSGGPTAPQLEDVGLQGRGGLEPQVPVNEAIEVS